jgi:hypothetical protein
MSFRKYGLVMAAAFAAGTALLALDLKACYEGVKGSLERKLENTAEVRQPGENERPRCVEEKGRPPCWTREYDYYFFDLDIFR